MPGSRNDAASGRRRSRIGLTAAAALLLISASIAVAVAVRSGPDGDGVTPFEPAPVVAGSGGTVISTLERARTGSDQLPAWAPAGIGRLADVSTSRLASSRDGVSVYLMRSRGGEDAVCVAALRLADGRPDGVVNCPDRSVIGAGKMVLKLQGDPAGPTVYFGAVPDGIALVRGAGEQAQVEGNVFILTPAPGGQVEALTLVSRSGDQSVIEIPHGPPPVG